MKTFMLLVAVWTGNEARYLSEHWPPRVCDDVVVVCCSCMRRMKVEMLQEALHVTQHEDILRLHNWPSFRNKKHKTKKNRFRLKVTILRKSEFCGGSCHATFSICSIHSFVFINKPHRRSWFS